MTMETVWNAQSGGFTNMDPLQLTSANKQVFDINQLGFLQSQMYPFVFSLPQITYGVSGLPGLNSPSNGTHLPGLMASKMNMEALLAQAKFNLSPRSNITEGSAIAAADIVTSKPKFDHSLLRREFPEDGKEHQVKKHKRLAVDNYETLVNLSSPSSEKLRGTKCENESCSRLALHKNRFCRVHGGRRKCRIETCFKFVVTNSLCKAHGGGRKCKHLNCTKNAQGKTDFCISHGGGKRCAVPNCMKSARGKTDHCIAHGGGRRCIKPECTKRAIDKNDFCSLHGGKRRCKVSQCRNPAIRHRLCAHHGGGGGGENNPHMIENSHSSQDAFRYASALSHSHIGSVQGF